MAPRVSLPSHKNTNRCLVRKNLNILGQSGHAPLSSLRFGRRTAYLPLRPSPHQTARPDAPIEAAMRADAMLERGDLDGYAVWKRILRAVRELLAAFILEGNFHLRAVDLDTSVLDMHIEIHDLGDPQVP